MSKTAKLISLLLAIALGTGGLFIYEVNRVHHYAPQTAEIQINDQAAIEDAFVIKDDMQVQFNLAEKLTFISDVEKGTADLETTKKVFGFYECEINRVYDEFVPSVTYVSSDESVATVDDSGIITASEKGKTTITVTGDGVSVDIPVTVYRAVQVTGLEQDVVLLKGDSKSFVNLDSYEVTLQEFYSSDEKVATVAADGTATAVGRGKAEIYTYTDEAKTEKISTQITVKQPVETVSLKAITLYQGQTAKLQTSYTPGNADYGTNFSYNSTDSSVASINGNVVSAVRVGETVITVRSGNGVTAQAKLVVLAPRKATPTVTTISKAEFDAYSGEKYSDGSPYVSYFKISFDKPVIGFRINYVNDDFTKITTGSAIYNNAAVAENTPLYFAVCVNTSDVVATRGFSYVNKDGSRKSYWLHFSGRDGSITYAEY